MIRFGPAGTGLGTLEGLKLISEKGLEAVEIEFTYGVRMSGKLAKEAGELAKKLGLMVSVHAPYYINLASEDSKKIEASKKRILQSCEKGSLLGAKYIVFHAAFYGKRSPDEVFGMVRKAVLELQEEIKKKKWDVILAPETTGKASQFGTIEELLRLKKETGCHLTVDFAHVKARANGSIDYPALFGSLKGLEYIHSHFSGIEYTEKGERRHLVTSKEDFVPLFREIKKHGIGMTIINESPDPLGDSLAGKALFESMK